MIKINLLSEGAPGTAANSTKMSYTNVTSTSAGSSRSTGSSDLLIKLACAVGPIIACVGTEQWIVGSKHQELTRIENELYSKQAEIESKKKDVQQVQKFRADKAQLEIRMNTIRDLSKARLKNVKALDAIQNIIPTKAWLLSLKLDDKKVDLKGRAMEDSDISSFMAGLEENIYFAQVVLISSASVGSEEGGIVKEFTISANLENL